MDLTQDKAPRLDYWPSFVNTMLFVDESGSRGLHDVDPNWPILSLFGAAFRKESYRVLSTAMNDLKRELWPPSGYFSYPPVRKVVFHSSDMRRKEGPFSAEVLTEERRAYMDERLWKIIDSDWFGLACVIDKAKHRSRYSTPTDPYALGVDFMIERVCMSGYGLLGIVFEARGRDDDKALWRSVRCTLLKGTSYFKTRELQRRIRTVGWCSKHDSGGRLSAGMEIADLCAYIAGARYLGRQSRFTDVVRRHLCGYPDNVVGRGYKVFPHP